MSGYQQRIGSYARFATDHGLSRGEAIIAVAPEAARVIHDLGNQIQCAASMVNVLRARLHQNDVGEWLALARSLSTTLRGAGKMAVELCGGEHPRALEPTVDVDALLPALAPALQLVVGDTILLECVAGVQGYGIECDVHALESSLLNLVMNARDALPRGGHITVSAWLVLSDTVRGAPDMTAHICLSVQDNGVGMPETLRARACEPFVTTKAAGKTRGLGLASVKRFTESIGGWLDIESRVDHGTSVLLYLPASRLD